MARMTETARLAIVAVKGSVLFEIRRLSTGWVPLDIGPPAGISPSAVALLCGDLSVLPIAFRDGLEVPILRVGFGQNMLLAPDPVHPIEAYDVADAFGRLMLLGRIAGRISYQAALPTQQEREQRDAFAKYPIYHCIASIQRTFNVHLSERELLDRVGISAASLYRRFRQSGTLTPSRLLQWVRMHEVAKRMVTNPSAEGVAQSLGFAHAESARRTMHKLTGMTSRSLQSTLGLAEFERRMEIAFAKKQ